MSERNSSNSRIVKNSLLSAAGCDFDSFSTNTVLFPASEESSLLTTSGKRLYSNIIFIVNLTIKKRLNLWLISPRGTTPVN